MILYHTSDREIGKPDMHCGRKKEGLEAVYLGVKDYGKEKTNRENFLYRFGAGAEEIILRIDNGTKDAEGNCDYPIQNLLKEGYRYFVTIEDGTAASVREIEETLPKYRPQVQGTEGKRTVTNFLKTALMPVGTTLYIYGGGWDWQDIGSAVQARSFGVSPDWVRFFESQDENFTYREKDGDAAKADPEHSYYPYGGYNEYYYAGLDCSGFVGWALYNTLETKEGEAGYVIDAAGMAKRLSECGFGEWTQDIKAPDGIRDMKPAQVLELLFGISDCEHGDLKFLRNPHFSVMQGKGKGIRRMAEF